MHICRRKKLDLDLSSYKKLNSRPKFRTWDYEVVERKCRGNTSRHCRCRWWLHGQEPSPKPQATTAQPYKRNYIKLRSFSTSKEIINRVNRQLKNWVKNIFKLLLWQRINFQNISATQKTQQYKNNQSNEEMGKGLYRKFLKKKNKWPKNKCKNPKHH